ncbi:hypothetical protein JCM8097_001778 [Rhodosporidiobolus ruineniae]
MSSSRPSSQQSQLTPLRARPRKLSRSSRSSRHKYGQGVEATSSSQLLLAAEIVSARLPTEHHDDEDLEASLRSFGSQLDSFAGTTSSSSVSSSRPISPVQPSLFAKEPPTSHSFVSLIPLILEAELEAAAALPPASPSLSRSNSLPLRSVFLRPSTSSLFTSASAVSPTRKSSLRDPASAAGAHTGRNTVGYARPSASTFTARPPISPMSSSFASPARPSPLGHPPPAPSTSSRAQLRTANPFTSSSSSKLSKRANRASRFMLGGVGSASTAQLAGQGSGSEATTKTKEAMQSQESLPEDGEEKSASFFELYYPPGGFSVQPYARDLQSFVSYSHASLDWDSLRTSSLFVGTLHGSTAYPVSLNDDGTTTPLVPPPKRVLDIGCGTTPFWVLKMARSWQETEFVALDAAPSSVSPNVISPDIASRVFTVQHDFRQPLPFADGEFDYVRVGFVNLAVGEQYWAPLIEEAMRVLKSGCLFEVVEQDFSVYRKKSRGEDPLTPSTASFSPSDRFAAIDSIFEDVLQDRFINSSPLTLIPSDLTMNGTGMRSTGRIVTPIVADPPTYDASTAHPLPETSTDAALDSLSISLEKYSPGSNAHEKLLKLNENRVILAAYADLWASSSYGVAQAAVSARTRVRSNSRRSRTSTGPEDLLAPGAVSIASSSPSTYIKEVQDVEDALTAWTDDLRERAGLAELLTSRFGWAPTVDAQMHAQLEENLPVYAAKLKELNQTKVVQESVWSEVDPEIEYRLQQLEFSKREAETEFAAVKRRLYGPERAEKKEGEEEELLGTADMAAFVVKAF